MRSSECSAGVERASSVRELRVQGATRPRASLRSGRAETILYRSAMRRGFLHYKGSRPDATPSTAAKLPAPEAFAAPAQSGSDSLRQAPEAVGASPATQPELQKGVPPSPEAAEAALQQCLELLRSSSDEKK